MDKKNTYLIFKKNLKIPVLIQVEDPSFYEELSTDLADLGFSLVDEDQVSSFKVQRSTTILALKRASAHLESIICRPYVTNEEALSRSSKGELYTKNNSALLLYSLESIFWQMAVSEKCDKESFKVAINRFLAMALSKVGIVSFWGVKAQNTLLVTSSLVSSAECLFFDIENSLAFDHEQSYELDSSLSFGRLDMSLKDSSRLLSREELYCFLFTNTSFLTLNHFPHTVQNNILLLAKTLKGFLYPEANFEKEASEIPTAVSSDS